jgi:hypothetical protein
LALATLGRTVSPVAGGVAGDGVAGGDVGGAAVVVGGGPTSPGGSTMSRDFVPVAVVRGVGLDVFVV